MANVNNFLAQKFSKTTLANPKTKLVLSDILRREFYNPATSYERAGVVLSIAYHLQVPNFEEMLFDYDFTNFTL